MEPAEYALMDEAEDRMWWYRALHARLFECLAGVTGRVLDAGCGTGGLLAYLRGQRPDLVLIGLERSGHGIRRAAAKSQAPVVCGTVNSIPFDAFCFDAAIVADVLCHGAVDPEAALPELKRVIRPGGRLIVNMPAYPWLLSVHDRRVHNVRRQTASQVRRMLAAAGFSQVVARYWNGLLLPLMVAQRKLFSRHDSASDVARFPPQLDSILHGVTEIERRLRVAPPAGGSVLATVTRP
ncbi:MAG: class I SAM-dependent methyltransferase [Acetobacteraceae bacterium]|nr:class I SAM-dependent methyltransferase [Acetobacteraceae bacterium]